MDAGDIKKKYPVSKKGHQCLGPCYYPGTGFTHPLFLTYMKSNDKPQCPTGAYSTPGHHDKLISDVCLIPTHNENSKDDLSLLTLSPFVEFNEDHFLKIYYEIYSLEDSINWINDNNNYPLATQNRVFNMALKVHGRGVEIVDHRVVDYLKVFLITNIKYIYKVNLKYIGVVNNEVKLMDPSKHKSETTNSTARVNYIIEMFLNNDVIYKFITKYLKTRKTEWNDIDDHLLRIVEDMAEYIESKIRLTLDI